MTAKNLKDRTISQINHSVSQVSDFFASLTLNNSPTPIRVQGSPLSPRSTYTHAADKVKHVARSRLLQSAANATPTVTTVTDPSHGFTFTFNNFFGNANSSVFQTSQLYAIHQTYDLRTPINNSSNSTNMSASLSFQSNGLLVPNQITLLLPSSYNLLNLQFSKSCVFPIAASSPSLSGINSTTGKINAQTVPQWLQIFAPNAFEVFATQLAFGGLNSGVNGNVTVQYPNFAKDAATNQRLYSQELYFADKLPPIRLVQIYCPVIDSPDGSWSVNITGSNVQGPVVNPPANTTNATTNVTNNQTNTTNGTTTNNTSPNGFVDPTNGNNTSIPDPNSSVYQAPKLNKLALILGVVLGTLLLVAVIVIIVLCVKLSKKRQEIITDEGYGPNAGFKQFDEERKVAVTSSDFPTNGAHSVQTTNHLPVITEKGDVKAEGDAGFGWRKDDPIVIAEDDAQNQENPFGQPAKPYV